MSDELRDLYQQVIVDHSKRPRNFVRLAEPTCQAEGFNPLCGDQVTIFLEREGDVIKKVTFQGSGCAISTASASMMTDALAGKSVAETEKLFQDFHRLVTATPEANEHLSEDVQERLGKLAVFSGVCEFPARIKCATLAWHTLNNALRGEATPAKTE